MSKEEFILEQANLILELKSVLEFYGKWPKDGKNARIALEDIEKHIENKKILDILKHS